MSAVTPTTRRNVAFVKIDCGILRSTLWMDQDARIVFLTALLMAEPTELTEPAPEIATRSLDYTGWSVPPGWYGFVHAASVGIIAIAGLEREEGLAALERLAAPDPQSRSQAFDGRRMVRVDGGYIILNYARYRERDYTSADRSRRYRERLSSRRDIITSRRDITARTQAEEEAEEEEKKDKYPPGFLAAWVAYPHFRGRSAKREAAAVWSKLGLEAQADSVLAWVAASAQSEDWSKDGGHFVPGFQVWLKKHDFSEPPTSTPRPAPQGRLGKAAPMRDGGMCVNDVPAHCGHAAANHGPSRKCSECPCEWYIPPEKPIRASSDRLEAP